MAKNKYIVELKLDEDQAIIEYQDLLDYILEETECFIYDSSEMRQYIRYEADEEVSENISSAQDLYKWAKRHFNKCHVMLIEKYSHGGDAFYAVEVDTEPTCRWDSGITGIIAVPKKRFRNPQKTKDFMRDLVSQFSEAINETYYNPVIENLFDKTKTYYQTVNSDLAYDIENTKNDEELERILNKLEVIDTEDC